MEEDLLVGSRNGQSQHRSDRLFYFLAVKITLAQISMENIVQIDDVHKVRITMYRDPAVQPPTLWQNDHCFMLTFDDPYQSGPTGSLWSPFDRNDPPECEVCNHKSNLNSTTF